MKLGDITIRQVAKICADHNCDNCQFHYDNAGSCKLLRNIPSQQDLNMEVKVDAENQS